MTPHPNQTMTTSEPRTFDAFMEAVERQLTHTAAGKGYSSGGPDGQNQLYEFIETMNGGQQHALGEIIYKARRYAAKGNLEDVIKIAAWAFLIYKHEGPKSAERLSEAAREHP